MSTTTQFTTFADLYTGLLKAMRTDTGNAATIEQAKRYINTAHMDIHLGFAEKVPWAIRELGISSRTYTTATGTISSVAGITPPVGQANTTDIFSQTYEFNNPDLLLVPTGTKFVVTTSALGDTVAFEGVVEETGVGEADPQPFEGWTRVGQGIKENDIIRLYQDDIEMPADFMRLAGNTIRIGTKDLDLIGRVEFRHRFAGKIELGRPTHATLIDSWDITNGGEDNRKIRLYPIPNVTERVYITYVTKNIVLSGFEWASEFVEDTDQTIMPLRYRHAIFFHALYNWYRDRKDDTRSQEAKAEYIEIMSRIMNDNESGQSTMSIRPNVQSYRRKSGRPYRRGGRSSRYDFGRFDRLD